MPRHVIVNPTYVPTSDLGSGTANATTFLRGDQSWATPSFTITVGTTTLSGGTTGSVLFVGAGSVIQQDNANFFWDDSNNRLSLGAGSSPSFKVDVSGSTTSLMQLTNTAASGTGAGGGFRLVSNDGAAIASGDRLGFFQLAGARDASNTINNSAAVTAYATENWSGTACGALMQFEACPNGSTTRVANLVIGGATLGFLTGGSVGTFDLSIGGSAARTFSMERVGSGNGNALTVQSGGGQSGSSNRNSGDLNLQCGTATGNGSGNVVIKAVAANQGSGTTDRTPATVATFGGKALALACGLRLNRTAVADTAYSMVEGDCYIEVTSLTAARTITLLAAATAGSGCMVIIKDSSGSAGTYSITVDGNGAETIDGDATAVISSDYGSLTLICNGTSWAVV